MSLNILKFVFLLVSSILFVFLFEQLIVNSFDKLRNNKINKLDNSKLHKDILASINNLYCREQAFSLKEDSINCYY